MDHAEIRGIISMVTKSLTPSRLDVDIQDDVVRLTVVSEKFAGLPISRRFDLLSDEFEIHASELVEAYTLIYQAWTTAEMAEIEADSGKGALSSDSQGDSRAAKQPEL